MIIVSQDKMEIFNFDEIFRLYVDNWSNEEFATEKRAKKVLQEIAQKYASFLKLEGGPTILQGQVDIQPNIFNIPKVYEMPED